MFFTSLWTIFCECRQFTTTPDLTIQHFEAGHLHPYVSHFVVDMAKNKFLIQNGPLNNSKFSIKTSSKPQVVFISSPFLRYKKSSSFCVTIKKTFATFWFSAKCKNGESRSDQNHCRHYRSVICLARFRLFSSIFNLAFWHYYFGDTTPVRKIRLFLLTFILPILFFLVPFFS